MAIPIYVDEQGNYYTLNGTQPVNVGWDVVNANGGMEAAIQLPADSGKNWRSQTGLAPAAPTDAQNSARAALKTQLDQWGLGSLNDWAWQQITSGASNEQIIAGLRETDAYKTRFAANAQRAKAGLPTLSEAQYVSYENQARQMMRAAGMPSGLFDGPEDFTAYIAGDVSVAELSNRVQLAHDYAAQDPTVNADERAQMTRLYGTGGLAAYYLDPEKALPVLQRQAQAAAAAAAAQRSGFGSLTKGQAERASELSGSIQQTAQAFTQLAKQKELMGALPGELGVDAITADQQIAGALGGDANVQNELSRRARKRAADMQAQKGDYKYGAGRSSTGSF